MKSSFRYCLWWSMKCWRTFKYSWRTKAAELNPPGLSKWESTTEHAAQQLCPLWGLRFVRHVCQRCTGECIGRRARADANQAANGNGGRVREG
jgi:hypothetical protein